LEKLEIEYINNEVFHNGIKIDTKYDADLDNNTLILSSGTLIAYSKQEDFIFINTSLGYSYLLNHNMDNTELYIDKQKCSICNDNTSKISLNTNDYSWYSSYVNICPECLLKLSKI